MVDRLKFRLARERIADLHPVYAGRPDRPNRARRLLAQFVGKQERADRAPVDRNKDAQCRAPSGAAQGSGLPLISTLSTVTATFSAQFAA